jgi:branched-chain amino acid transport system substrate-binding protein
MSPRALSCLWLVAAVFSFAWTPLFAAEKPPLKVAVSSPLSGPLGPTGKVQLIAIKAAVEEVNRSGGINGSPVQLLVYDDQFDPAQGILRVREAERSGAVVILGPYGSTQWETAVPLLNQLRMPGINMSATKPGINKGPYAFRMSNPDDRGMERGLKRFVETFPRVKTVAVIGDVREASGKAAVDNWNTYAKGLGLSVVGNLTYTSQADMSSYAIKLKEMAPDAILAGMLPADAIRFARELKLENVNVPILANGMIYGGVFPQSVSQLVGEGAANWYVVGFATNEWVSGDIDAQARFVKRFAEEVAKDPALAQYEPPNVANSNIGYDAVMLVADTLRKSSLDGSASVAELREKLRTELDARKTYRGLNVYTFEPSGDAIPDTILVRVDPKRSMYVRVQTTAN